MSLGIQPVGMVIGQTLTSLIKLVKQRLLCLDGDKLTLDQFGLLYAIYQHEEDVIQQDMAGLLGKDKSAILRMIDNLQKKNLLCRTVKECDRRKNQIALTEKGHEMIDHMIRIEDGVRNHIFEGLTEPEIATFYKVLATIRRQSEQI